MEIYVNDETSRLEALIFGLPDSFGGTPNMDETYDPKSKEFIRLGAFPVQEDVSLEMNSVLEVFEKYGVKVFRPKEIDGLNQIFSRDIGMVIKNKFIIPNIIKDREEEIGAIQHVIDLIPGGQVVEAPEGVRLEGGDIMPVGDHIFVGYSEEPDFSTYKVSRTNRAALEFLQSEFPNKKVVGFQLNKSDEEPRDNALHLDCCFQPVGNGKAVIYKGGFKKEEDYNFLAQFYGKENLHEITREEMYEMNSNFFSIAPDVVISEKNFTRLNDQLRAWGITVEEVPYAEISKMEGLLRCSTLPLKRVK